VAMFLAVQKYYSKRPVLETKVMECDNNQKEYNFYNSDFYICAKKFSTRMEAVMYNQEKIDEYNNIVEATK
jgi:hypothetical protein